MKKINEKLKDITIFETPETNEALSLLENAKLKFLLIKIIYIECFITIIPTVIDVIKDWNTTDNSSIKYLIFLIASFIALHKFYNESIRPYKELYRIARHNDQIRNDEHIRFKERIRLENELKQKSQQRQVSVDEIDRTIDRLHINSVDKKTLDNQIKSDKKILPPKKK